MRLLIFLMFQLGLYGCNIGLFIQVNPVHSDGRLLGENVFVRTGLLGFLGPVRTISRCLLLFRFVFFLN
jgi:hypothetical protein